MANSNENPNGIFREKSIERISSPEDLNEYVRVANPGVWMILAAIIVLLLGFVTWSVHGNLETTVQAVILTENGHTDCFVTEEDALKLEPGMTVRCNDKEYKVVMVSAESVDADDFLSDYAMHVSGIQKGEWIHPVQIDGVTEDGTFSAEIVIDSVKPIDFIFN